ncbi:MAG: S-layer homology domain-containing protein [Tissierellia bacterium]|nr:S-layer homology domain-containing protein [Tissierellia bacterium]
MNKKLAKILAIILAAFFVVGTLALAIRFAPTIKAECCNTCEDEQTEEEKLEEERKKEEEERRRREAIIQSDKDAEADKLIRQIHYYIEKFDNVPGYYKAIEMLKNTLDSLNPRTGYDPAVLRDALDKFHYDEKELEKNQVFTGDDFNMFRPDAFLTRAEFATILMRMDKKSIEGGENWYDTAMNHAVEMGYMKGDDFGNLMPMKEISVAEVVAVMVRYKEFTTLPGDIFGIGENHWAKGFIQRAYTDGWFKDIQNAEQVDRPIMRKEVAALLFHAQSIQIDRAEIDKHLGRYHLYSDVEKSNPYFYYILALSN